jgi:hypothetical protein
MWIDPSRPIRHTISQGSCLFFFWNIHHVTPTLSISPYLLFKEIRAENLELLIHGYVKPREARGDVTHYAKKRLIFSYYFGLGLQNNLFCFETFVKNKNIRVNRPCRPIGF